MSRHLYILLLSCIAGLAMAAEPLSPVLSANDAYRAADYHKAVTLYEQALRRGESAEAYYNLGNAYYRIDNIPKALLCYERANKMRPLDGDILHNMEIARGKTADKMPPESEPFFMDWLRWVLSLMTIQGWAYTALASLVVAMLLFLAYLFMDSLTIRRCSFYLSMLLLLCCAAGNLFAWQRMRILTTHDTAIVMAETAQVKASPTPKAPDACVIHEGTKVRITDHDISDWYGIRLPDGREGWIRRGDLDLI